MSSTGGPIQDQTQYYSFNLVNFNWFAWQDYEHSNWRLVDSLLFLALGGNRVRGYWLPGTAYDVGDRVVDDVDGTLWDCAEAHTSGNTTMADDRAANPTWWGAVVTGGGDVVGPVISVDNNITVFDGTTGKQIKDSGIGIADLVTDLNGLTDVTINAPVARHGLMNDGAGQFVNRLLVEADISDLKSYLTSEVNDLTAAVVWDDVPDANITQSSVVQHQAALSITESQISDLGNYALVGHTHTESDITDLKSYLLNVVEDTTPQLGGNLSTLGKQIEFKSGSDVLIGVAGTTAAEDGAFFVYSPDGNYTPTDGGVLVDAGGLELHGSVINAPSLAAPDNDVRQIFVDELGNLFGVEPPPSGWTVPVSDTSVYPLGSGSGTPAWTNLTGLAIPAQDVIAGQRLDIYVRVHAVNSSSNQSGSLAIGFGVDGVDPSGNGQIVPISPGFDGVVSVNLSTTTADITAGQTINIFARRTGGSGNFALTLDGTISIHEAIASLQAGAGGGGELTDGNKGDITVAGSGTVWTINNNVVDNAKMSDMAAWTLKGRNTGTTGDPQNITNASVAEDATPSAGIKLLGWAADNSLVRADVGNLPIGDLWSDPVDADIEPNTDTSYRLGGPSNRFVSGYVLSMVNNQLEVSSFNTGIVVSKIKGAAGQTGNLTDWVKSDNTILASVDAAGNIAATNLSGTNTGDAFLENHPFAMTNPTDGTLSGAEMATAGTVTRVSAAFAGIGITAANVMVRKKSAYNGAATDLLATTLAATAVGAVAGNLQNTSLNQFDILEVEVSGVTGTVAVTDQVIVNVHVEHVGGT